MRRSLHMLLWVSLGALAAGASTGWFLHRSNQDRERLAQDIGRANQQINILKTQLEQITQESNQKVALAAQEVARIDKELQTHQEDEARLKIAVALTPLSRAQLRGWSETASISMNVALRIPPGMEVTTSDDGIFINTKRYSGKTPVIEQWLALTNHQTNREQEIRTRLSNTQNVTYALNGRILKGVRGNFMATDQTLYLLSFQGTSTTHLLWAKTVPGVTERTILDTISTLSFR